ncbi:RAD51-associated protein 1 isoform X2 [Stegastes partitus]|uniref:RAD51-associated protein 1 isoform X2 n=1 Tax=Stegastes partitus TaxID=144197 RepID=A0A9Y4JUK9_9TELE|nr:PREDICTED: RAD51-associated protein 1 isoform X2 [Stegastes partitus]
MDRPSRRAKIVNYCEAKDFDDDEDFACVKAPPSKKAREDVKHEQKKSSSKSSSQETTSQSTLSQKSRKPLDEKLYARDLEAAITLSLLNNADEIKEVKSPTSKGDVTVQLPVDENTDPASLLLSNCSVDGAVMGLDQITSDKGSPAPSKQRKAASKASEELRKKDKDDEDEDYQPKLTPDSESEEDFSEPAESEDEEFTVKKVTKTKKKEKVTKNDKTKPTSASKKEKQTSKPSKSKSPAAASTPVRSPPTAKLAPKRPASSSTVSTLKSAVSVSPAGGRIPKWNPPAQIGKSPTSSKSPTGKSPGQGLRLGLSRLVRVKPLHPSVASH